MSGFIATLVIGVLLLTMLWHIQTVERLKDIQWQLDRIEYRVQPTPTRVP